VLNCIYESRLRSSRKVTLISIWQVLEVKNVMFAVLFMNIALTTRSKIVKFLNTDISSFSLARNLRVERVIDR
jgi:hypothetical protein